MDAQDGGAPGHVRGLDGDLPVKAPGAQQGLVQHVGAVGGGNEDDVGGGVKAVHLHQELVEGLLALVVAPAHAGSAVAPDGVNLVHEDNRGGVLLGLLEQVAHARGPHAHEHLHELRAAHGEEGHAGLPGHGPRQEGLTGAGRPVEQDALGDLGAHGLELLRLGEELTDLLELLDGLVLPGDVREGDVGHLLLPHLGLGAAEAQGSPGAALHASQEPPHEAQEQDHGQQELERGAPPAGGGHHRVVATGRVGGLDELIDLLGLGGGVDELDLGTDLLVGLPFLLGLEGVGLGEIQLHALGAVDDGHGLDGGGAVLEDIQAVGGVHAAVAAHGAQQAPGQDGQQDEGQDPGQRVAQGAARQTLLTALGALALGAPLVRVAGGAALTRPTSVVHARYPFTRC